MSLNSSVAFSQLEAVRLNLQELKDQPKTVGTQPGGQPVNLTFFSNQLLYNTVQIVAALPDGHSNYGTAFLFALPAGAGQNIPFLITNNHVVNGAATIAFALHRAKENAPLVS
jgi:hypothetical protein